SGFSGFFRFFGFSGFGVLRVRGSPGSGFFGFGVLRVRGSSASRFFGFDGSQEFASDAGRSFRSGAGEPRNLQTPQPGAPEEPVSRNTVARCPSDPGGPDAGANIQR